MRNCLLKLVFYTELLTVVIGVRIKQDSNGASIAKDHLDDPSIQKANKDLSIRRIQNQLLSINK